MMMTRGAAMLDFEVGVGEVPPTFRVENPILGGVPGNISDIPVQMQRPLLLTLMCSRKLSCVKSEMKLGFENIRLSE